MYGKNWKDGKTEEEIKLHGLHVHEGHKKRTKEQKQ